MLTWTHVMVMHPPTEDEGVVLDAGQQAMDLWRWWLWRNDATAVNTPRIRIVDHIDIANGDQVWQGVRVSGMVEAEADVFADGGIAVDVLR